MFVVLNLYIKNLNKDSRAFYGRGWTGKGFPTETLIMKRSYNYGYIYAQFISNSIIEKEGFVIFWTCEKTTHEYTESRLL